MSNYSIKDLEQLSGIKAHTLRIWEQRYNIINPKRTDTNIRTYDEHDLKLVLNIALLQEHDYKISKIAKLPLEELNEKVLAISELQLNYPDQIHALTIAMLDFDEERFEKIMNTNILQFGFENTMMNIIYPFMGRIGTLWLTGSVGPAQEHFMTNLIRQKIIVAIDGQVVKISAGSRKYILFCPEGELHEMGLLFANFILRARNNKVIYLGQNMPFNELTFAYEAHKPDFIFSVITSTPGQDGIQQYVYRLAKQFSETQIILTGHQVVGQDIDTPPNVQILTNVRQLMEMASHD
jgi:MerR family transcriptional regulator, light-induced transcriptional regulator